MTKIKSNEPSRQRPLLQKKWSSRIKWNLKNSAPLPFRLGFVQAIGYFEPSLVLKQESDGYTLIDKGIFVIGAIVEVFDLLVVAVLAGESSKASEECLKPKALFGKIVVMCERFNLAYTGDEKVFVKKLNLHTTTSRFELNMCNGGGRFPIVRLG